MFLHSHAYLRSLVFNKKLRTFFVSRVRPNYTEPLTVVKEHQK